MAVFPSPVCFGCHKSVSGLQQNILLVVLCVLQHSMQNSVMRKCVYAEYVWHSMMQLLAVVVQAVLATLTFFLDSSSFSSLQVKLTSCLAVPCPMDTSASMFDCSGENLHVRSKSINNSWLR